ncbi:MAG: DsbA family protein [Candidatus Pacebacteria bacterium]|nr:DsbA family protein [Candidatus Paceibacterota bacterium]
MKNLPLLIATIVGTLGLVIGVALFFSAPEEEALPAQESLVVGERALEELAQTGPVQEQAEVTDATDSTNVMESEVIEKSTLVVFSDFQCPACKSLEDSFLTRNRAVYEDKVNLVFRHFPLDSIHPYARQAAWASEAAKDAGKFMEYHDLLFEKQAEWSSLNSKDDVRDVFIEYALELDIDKDNFIARMESDDIKKRVSDDVADGNSLKVNSTPTIYLDNNKTAPQDLAKQIELLLNE